MVDQQSHSDMARRFIDGRSWASGPAVSPDGERIACVVATTRLEQNTTLTQVWLDGTPLTGGDHDGGPCWSPDSRFLAFTSRRSETEGEATLHVIPVAVPGELRTIATMPEGIDDLTWSPDGKWIAFISRTRDERYDAEDASWQSPRKVERFGSRLDGKGWIYDRPAHVHVVAVDGTSPPRNLTPGGFQHAGTSWLPDSSAIVTSAQRHDTWDVDHASDIYVVSVVDDAGFIRLTAGDGRYTNPSVSPDGTKVAFIGATDARIYPTNDQVLIASTTETEQVKTNLVVANPGFDRTFAVTTGTPKPQWAGHDAVLAVAEDRGDTHVYRLAADGSAEPQAITTGPSTVTGLSWAAGTLATTRTSATSPAELFVGEEQRTTVAQPPVTELVDWERFTVPTADGTADIDAWIVRPAGFDASRRYPVLLNVHGGPFAQYGEYFFDEAQMQAAAGFVVVMGNPRGSSGRNTEWGRAILGPQHPVHAGRGWGSVDIDDVMSILDGALDRFTFCDRDRVGMLGGSYGGYMATWLAALHGERFKGICSERAVNNLTALEWNSDIATRFRLQFGVSHLDDPAFYADRSPIRLVDQITTPMLLLHSENDERCPVSQAEELWVALRLRGLTRRLLPFSRRAPRTLADRVADPQGATGGDHSRLVR